LSSKRHLTQCRASLTLGAGAPGFMPCTPPPLKDSSASFSSCVRSGRMSSSINSANIDCAFCIPAPTPTPPLPLPLLRPFPAPRDLAGTSEEDSKVPAIAWLTVRRTLLIKAISFIENTDGSKAIIDVPMRIE